MAFGLIKTINLPSADFFIANTIVFKENDEVVTVSKHFDRRPIKFDFPFVIEQVNNDSIYVRNKEGLVKVVNSSRTKIPLRPIDAKKQVRSITNDRVIYRSEDVGDHWTLKCIDFSGVENWSRPDDETRICAVMNDKLLSWTFTNILVCYSLHTGALLWKADLKLQGNSFEPGMQPLSALHGIVIVEGPGNKLLRIDPDTGSVIWHRHFDNNLSFTYSHVNEKIHVFSYGKYFEIDTLSGRIDREHSFEQVFHETGFSKVGHTAPAVDDKNMVISSSFESKTLVMDRSTLGVVQVLTLSGNYVSQTNTPLLRADRLYILDAQNILHIFERGNI